jgi:hypothetical protein
MLSEAFSLTVDVIFPVAGQAKTGLSGWEFLQSLKTRL